MKIKINENEIRNIVADYYGANVNNVTVYTEEELRGYGMGEHTEHVIVATIGGDGFRIPSYGEHLDTMADLLGVIREKDEADVSLRKRLIDKIDHKEYNRWFSCDEKFPEPYEVVLAAAKMDGENEFLVYMGSHTLKDGWNLIGVENSYEYYVSKWRPIPEIN